MCVNVFCSLTAESVKERGNHEEGGRRSRLWGERERKEDVDVYVCVCGQSSQQLRQLIQSSTSRERERETRSAISKNSGSSCQVVRQGSALDACIDSLFFFDSLSLSHTRARILFLLLPCLRFHPNLSLSLSPSHMLNRSLDPPNADTRFWQQRLRSFSCHSCSSRCLPVCTLICMAVVCCWLW